jgi:hypothetical protein
MGKAKRAHRYDADGHAPLNEGAGMQVGADGALPILLGFEW